jgi:fibro-slime domain-containing protein
MDLTGRNIESWANFQIHSCSLPSNCQNRSNYGTAQSTSALFATSSQVWLSPNGSNGWTIAYAGPDSRIVYLQSPWTQTLPQIKFIEADGDSPWTTMREDTTRCGWFWAMIPDSINSGAVSAAFRRNLGQVLFPSEFGIPIPANVSANDTFWISSNATTNLIDPGARGTCLVNQKIIHVQNPWMLDEVRGSLPIYISGNGISANQPLTAAPQEFWSSFNFDFNYNNDTYEISSFEPTPTTNRVAFPQRIRPADLFSYGIYEVWLFAESNTFTVSYDPPNPRYLHVLNPWSGTVPRLLQGGDTLAMQSVEGKCGWYRRILDGNNLQDFRLIKAMGAGAYTQDGLFDALPLGGEISVATLFNNSDSVWIMPMPFPTGSPSVSTTFPGTLGDCPQRDLAVMIFDWPADGPDGSDFENAGCGGHITGMVQSELSPDGLPVKSNPMPASCNPADLNRWFIPQVLSGTYTNATCYDLPLEMDSDGFWVADIAANASRGISGFFPIDDFTHLDPANTIPNPNRSQSGSSDGTLHNFHFTMHVNAEFQFVRGQYFTFRGDDDVWVFINNRLVVDIGGIHGPVSGSVDLDTLGLDEGATYRFNIFFAERQTSGSNFMMRTSIDLRTDRTLLYETLQLDSGRVQYDVKQILSQSDLRCDFSVSQSEPVPASAIYSLSGPQFSGSPVTLNNGVNYGGIILNEEYTSFTIDTLAIIRTRSLAPGVYQITFTHSLDPTLSGSITFTVPEYPLPEIRFVDALQRPIDPDTVILGEYAYVAYPVYVEAFFPYGHCDICQDELHLNSTDSMIFMDSTGSLITSIMLKDGWTAFRVYGLVEISNGSFTVGGAGISNTLTWSNINLEEPPVPAPLFAAMYDSDGNGIPDSLFIEFSRSLESEPPDSLKYRFPNTGDWERLTRAVTLSYLQTSTDFILSGQNFSDEILTSGNGTALTWFSSDEGQFEMSVPIQDKMGPVILSAEIALSKGAMDTLFVYFSEPILREGLSNDQSNGGLWFKTIDNGVWTQGVMPAVGARWNDDAHLGVFLFFSDAAPKAGDSLRIATSGVDVIWTDHLNNPAHTNNPLVPIKGRRRGALETVTLGQFRSEDFINEKTSVFLTTAELNQTAQDMYKQTGALGHLIRNDLSAYIINSTDGDLTPKDIELFYEVWYYSSLGGFVDQTKGEVTCADMLLFQGDCTQNPGHVYVGWNYRSEKGRLVGTGAYPVYFRYRIEVKGEEVENKLLRETWGVRRLKD